MEHPRLRVSALKVPAGLPQTPGSGGAGTVMPGGARVPAPPSSSTRCGGLNIGAMIRWLDFNDTWLAAEWATRRTISAPFSRSRITWRATPSCPARPRRACARCLTAMIKAARDPGVLALENSFNRVGLDHVLLVRVASTAVVASMLGASLDQVVNAVSNAWIDGGALRTYRHAPNTGSRKSWAAGDATSRAVRHALIALTGETALPVGAVGEDLGLLRRALQGRAFSLPQPFGSYVMENVLFKISYPAEFHAQTAVEAAMTLHPQVRDRLADIERIVIETQEPGVRIHRQGGAARQSRRPRSLPPVHGRGAADFRAPHRGGLRGHGRRRCAHRCAARQDAGAREPDVHAGVLRPRQALHRQCRAGVSSATAAAARACRSDFPIGHRKRRAEGMPLLVGKFTASVDAHFAPRQAEPHQGAVRPACSARRFCR